MPQAPYFKLTDNEGRACIISMAGITDVVFEPSNGVTSIYSGRTCIDVPGYDTFDYIDKMLQLETILIDFDELKELAPQLDKLISFNKEMASPSHSIIHILKNCDKAIEDVRKARERVKTQGDDIAQLAFEFDNTVN